MNEVNLGRVVGLSAYELAVQQGFHGTLDEWLESLKYVSSDEYKELTENVEQAASEIKQALGEVDTSISNIEKAVQDGLNGISTLISSGKTSISEAKTEALQAIADETNTSIEELKSQLSSLEETISQARDEAVSSVENTGNSWKQQVENSGSSWVNEVEEAGTSWKQQVEGEGTKQVQNVSDEKDKAVTEIENTKDTIISEIQEASSGEVEKAKQEISAEAERVIATIPEDYTQVQTDIKSLFSEVDMKAPAIIQTAKGEEISIEGSADSKLKGLRIFGKGEQRTTTGAQLLNIASLPKPIEGIIKYYPIETEGVVTLSTNAPQDNGSANVFLLSGNVTSGASSAANGSYFRKPVTVSASGGYVTIAYRIQAYNPFDYEVMLNAGSSALPYEPYTGEKPSPSVEYPQDVNISGEDGNINVKLTGIQKIVGINEYTFNFVEGATVNSESLYVSIDSSFNGNEQSFLSFESDSDIPFSIAVFLNNSSVNKYNEGLVINVKKGLNTLILKATDIEPNRLQFRANVKPTQNITVTFKNIFLKNKSNESQYQPYERKTFVVPTPNGLPGVPVDSGGNYTDKNGQNYVSNYVDSDKRKMYQYISKGEITKVNIITNNRQKNPEYFGCECSQFNTEIKGSQTKGVICNKNFYIGNDTNINGDQMTIVTNNGTIVLGIPKNIVSEETVDAVNNYLAENPFEIYYTIAEPIVTDVSDEEIQAYEALETYYPNTNITTDDEVQPGIEVDYSADTKMYIDSKFNTLAQQIINQMGGN